MDIKGLLKDRIVQFLIFVVVLNIICFVLIWRLNIFVHGDLYEYGLIFSCDWADDFYFNNINLWVFLEGATALILFSIIPHRQHSTHPSKFTKWTGFLLPSIAIIYQALSIMFLSQTNNIVYNQLYDFGLNPNYNWATTYNPISSTAIALILVGIIALIIPAIRTLQIIEFDIVQEE